MPQQPALIGRDDILSTMRRELGKGRNVLLTGAAGIGKSALLQASFAADGDDVRAIYIEQASPTKAMLVELARQLHERYGALPLADIAAAKKAAADADNPADLPWSSIKKPVSRLTIPELSDLCLTALGDDEHHYIIYLDHMDRVTPSQRAVLEALFERVTVAGATVSKQQSGHLAKLWWSFKVLDIEPLSKQAAEVLLDAYLEQNTVLIQNRKMFRRQALQAAGGNPQALMDILENAGKERVVDRQYIREEVKHDAGDRYISLAPMLLVMLACVAAYRFVARGAGDQDLVVLSGVVYAFFMIFRPFIFRGMVGSR